MLNEKEQLVLNAERRFRSLNKRMMFVNSELGCRFLPDGTLDPRDKHKSIPVSSYYWILGTIKVKDRERLLEHAKEFEHESLADYDELLSIKLEKWDIFYQLKSEGHTWYADQVLNEIVAMQPYISNQREALALVLENESKVIKKAIETSPDSLVPSGS